MIRRDRPIVSAGLVTAAALHVALVTSAHAARVERVNQAVDGALRTLYGHAAGARALRDKASAVLVFPRIVKTGSASGERGGAGVLREHGISTGYYRSLGVFHGVEPGIESFGYALFFMSKPALDVLRRSDGWEIGTGPSVLVVDEGTTRQPSTAGPQDDIFAFVFTQKGLMVGVELRGSKITRFRPKGDRRVP
jgi:lipid-binding SYLF domain-containing protein